MAIIQEACKASAEFQFLQVVRLLEKAGALTGQRQPLGEFVPPAEEAVRFQSELTLGFSENNIRSVDTLKTPHGFVWRATTALMGFFGANGTLPYPYSEWMLQRLKRKDSSFLRFLESFHHRVISLYYRALGKYQLPFSYERASLPFCRQNVRCRHSEFLGALAGIISSQSTDLNSQSLHPYLFFSGFYSHKVRDKKSLQKILEYTFGISVCIEDFIGTWYELEREVRTRLRGSGTRSGNSLGRNLLIGSRAWLTQDKIRIDLGPIAHCDAHRYLPGCSANDLLRALSRKFIGQPCDIEYRLQVLRRTLPERNSLSQSKSLKLGWNICLSGASKKADVESETFLIQI